METTSTSLGSVFGLDFLLQAGLNVLQVAWAIFVMFWPIWLGLLGVAVVRVLLERRARTKQGVDACPKCGSRMVLRTAKRGANAGGKFWGCSSFPKCRHIQDYAG